MDPGYPSGTKLAARAASTIRLCAHNNASPSVSVSRFSSRLRSSPPRARVIALLLAREIEKTCSSPRADSITRLTLILPSGSSRRSSRSLRRASKIFTWSADSAFGSITSSSCGRTQASKSFTSSRNSLFTRTRAGTPPLRAAFRASGSVSRAASFSSADTLSSRSRTLAPPPRRCAFSTKLDTLAGRINALRLTKAPFSGGPSTEVTPSNDVTEHLCDVAYLREAPEAVQKGGGAVPTNSGPRRVEELGVHLFSRKRLAGGTPRGTDENFAFLPRACKDPHPRVTSLYDREPF